MEDIQIKEENNEFCSELIVSSPEHDIKYEILEIEEMNTEEEFNEENIYETLSDDFKQQFINKKIAKIYLDLDTKDSLKFICLSCNITKTSYDNIFNHVINNEDTCGNLQIINNDSELEIGEEKFGELFLEDNFVVVFKCSFCHSTLKNKNKICSHLSEHLNECESDDDDNFKMETETDDDVYFRKKMADVYLLQHSNYKFLYSCNSCNQKRMTFQSISDHLESNIETCGNLNINIKIENDKDDIIDKIHNKVCEIFMDMKRKLSLMCLYCCDFYTEMKSLSEHLLVHTNNEVIDKSFNDLDVLAKKIFIDSSESNSACSTISSLPEENKSNLKSSLIKVVLTQLVNECCSAKDDSSNLTYLKNMFKARKRKRILIMSQLSQISHQKKKKRPYKDRDERDRKISIFSRSIDEYSENDFKNNLGMSKDTFHKIQNILYPLWLQRITGRPPYSLKECLFITLWKLSTGQSFHEMRVRFGMANSSLYSIYSRILTVILMMKEKVIRFPSEESSLKQIAKDFQQSHSFPSVIGCIDGMHVRILQPHNNSLDYYNQKDFFSLIAQVVVDSNLKFLDTFVGFPGKFSNSDVWDANPLKKSIEEKNVKFPFECYLLGDETYPLKTYLMVPFNGTLSLEEQNFNKILKTTHECVDHAFKLLKKRFRILNALKIQRIPLAIRTIDSCMILHNIILENEDVFNNLNNSIDFEIFEHKNVNMNISIANDYEDNNKANEKRNEIKNLLSNKI